MLVSGYRCAGQRRRRSLCAMQALSLAVSLTWLRVQGFVENGGTVLDREGSAYTLDELRKVWQR